SPRPAEDGGLGGHRSEASPGPKQRHKNSPKPLDEHRSIERYNRTLQVEWAHRQVFLTNAERSNALAPWLEFYTTRRRHSAIGGLPRISRLP
ncbi:MAG TPA: integrase core domain-containing protein, partial [Nocardioidaceae bacterium]|nr:integrase core domain-containing protein [Nocardioidaceae bacterium]